MLCVPISAVRQLSNPRLRLLRLKAMKHTYFCKWASTDSSQMHAWEFNAYGGTDKLVLTDRAKIPVISSPTDILVKIHASSVNPIDVKMLGNTESYFHRN